MLNEVWREVVDDDIAMYFSEELKDMRHYLGRHIIGRLVAKAFRLPISAAAACQFIKNGKRYATHAHTRLSLILERGTDLRNAEKELEQIYTPTLSESVGETHEKDDDYEVDEDEFIYSSFLDR